MRLKTCKSCGTRFEPARQMQVACSWQCAIEHSRKLKEARDRKEHQAAKERLKTLTDWLDEAQVWVNRYIRLRDAYLGCISCGTTNQKIQYAAGHFRTRKAASHLRFHHDNLHKQCNHYCNKMLSGNIAEYRPALISKIGLDRVVALENDNRVHKWTIEECRNIIAEHKKLIRELDNNRGMD